MTKSLENITIHQFRGLRELELKNLGQINLLVGINNSGKTSVLEALSIYCHPLDLKVWLNTARQREQEYRVSRTPYLDSLQWLFTHDSLVSPASHRSDIGQFRLLSEVRFANFKTDVIDLLRQMDSNISDLEILLPPHSLSARFNIYIQHEKLGLVPVSTFGDGVRRLLHIALKLASVKGGILFIDELESAIHTEALQSSFNWLVKWCQKMNVQLFATTHSLEAVDALLEVTEPESDLVLYRLEPKENYTRVVRHDWTRLKSLREDLGQEVRW